MIKNKEGSEAPEGWTKNESNPENINLLEGNDKSHMWGVFK